MVKQIAIPVLVAFLATAGCSQLTAQGLALALDQVATGLARPVVITHAGDGSGRLFIAEQPGRILILEDGSILPTPFLDISALVEDGGNEQGLLGLAFHPDYWKPNDEGNGLFFVNYTEPEPSPPVDCPTDLDPNATCDANSVVARYQVSADDPDAADPTSAQILFKLNQPRTNHNGGNLAFGPDGYLYIGFGDGGGGGDPYLNGQNTSTLHGSILRIDVDSSPPAEPNDLCGLDPASYGIPADNPLAGQAGACDEIWAYGLRNPWRFSFDRDTADLFIGDVGQNTIEEVDFQASTSAGGENYGWNCYEGSLPYPGGSTCSGPVVFPILEYPHSNPTDPDNSGRSVTGGYVYRGGLFPQLTGVYFYGDFGVFVDGGIIGRVWGTVPRCDGLWQSQLLLENPFWISSFGEDEDGELYMTEFEFSGTGSKVHRLVQATGSGGPLLSAVPSVIDFGSVQIGTVGVRELVLTNANGGPEALLIGEMDLSDPAVHTIDPASGSNPCSSLTPCLAPGESCSVLLSFSPTAPGPVNETADISGNTPPLAVTLAASGVACSTTDPRVLPNETVTDTRTEEACGTLAAGPYEIGPGGNVSLRAGAALELRDGFTVSIGSQLSGEIDPGLLP